MWQIPCKMTNSSSKPWQTLGKWYQPRNPKKIPNLFKKKILKLFHTHIQIAAEFLWPTSTASWTVENHKNQRRIINDQQSEDHTDTYPYQSLPKLSNKNGSFIVPDNQYIIKIIFRTCQRYEKQAINMSIPSKIRKIPFQMITGWLFGTWLLFFHSVGNVIIPTDFFSEGWRKTTNQLIFCQIP